jgi:hypothetical protein
MDAKKNKDSNKKEQKRKENLIWGTQEKFPESTETVFAYFAICKIYSTAQLTV